MRCFDTCDCTSPNPAPAVTLANELFLCLAPNVFLSLQHCLKRRGSQDDARDLLKLFGARTSHVLHRGFAQRTEALFELGQQNLRDALRGTLRGTFLQALFATALDQLFGSGHVIRLHRRFDLAEGKA
jgi:hypothetical protein